MVGLTLPRGFGRVMASVVLGAEDRSVSCKSLSFENIRIVETVAKGGADGSFTAGR